VRYFIPQTGEAIPPHLATFVHKAKLESIVGASSYRRNFGGYPALFLVGEPDAGSFAVDVFGHLISPGYLNFDLDVVVSTVNQRTNTVKSVQFARVGVEEGRAVVAWSTSRGGFVVAVVRSRRIQVGTWN
jgi:hypothetical protein